MKININFDNFVILVLMKKYDRKLVKKKTSQYGKSREKKDCSDYWNNRSRW